MTFLVGENGSGKSTLIEAIAIKAGFNAEGGNKNFTTKQRPSESSLHEHVRLHRGTRRETGGFFLRAETMFNVATEVEANQYDHPDLRHPWERIHDKSHGEAFLYVLRERFRSNGLFILDEPESALSPQRQLVALAIIDRLVRAGSQFVIATHSPILMAYPGATILRLDDSGLTKIAWQDTEHVAVTKAFLNDPVRMMQRSFVGNDLDDDDGLS
ncbi:MAG TPA: AAA family ATPase [Myxococcota bacterium]